MKNRNLARFGLGDDDVQRKFQPSKALRKMTNRPGFPIRIGYIPVTDCVPLIAAQRLDLFARHGLNVSLHCEVGWASIREKLIHGELDATQAVAGMAVALPLGLQGPPVRVITPFIFSLQGNAITLSRSLWNKGVRDASSLKKLIRSRRDQLLTFGIVSLFSSQNFMLRRWLQQGGIDPDHDVRMLAFPPGLMAENLADGLLDGFCAGEPWGSQAVADGAGWCPAVSQDLLPGHPEKVLIIHERLNEEHPDQVRELCAALSESCEFCEVKENRPTLVKWLVESGSFDVSASVLRRSLIGPFDDGMGKMRESESFHIFAHRNSNQPTAERSAWVADECSHHGLLPGPMRSLAMRELSRSWTDRIALSLPAKPRKLRRPRSVSSQKNSTTIP